MGNPKEDRTSDEWADRLTSQILKTLRNVDFERAVELCTDILEKNLKASAVALWRLTSPEEGQPQLELVTHRNLPNAVVDELLHIPLDNNSLTATAARTGQIQSAEDLSRLPGKFSLAHLVQDRLGLVSLVAIPLTYDHNVVGVITYGTQTTAILDIASTRLIQSVAQILQSRLDEKHAIHWDKGLVKRVEALHKTLNVLMTQSRLNEALEKIAHIAKDMVGAKYGAVGILDANNQLLSHFAVTQMECGGASPPTGKGVLGVILQGAPMRLSDLSKHPQSVGFPKGHPPMQSFVGVPIYVEGKPFGNLYVTEKENGQHFTYQDERALTDLAAQAGLAIEYQSIFAMRREEQLIRAFLEALPQGILFVKSPDGSLVNANRRAEDLVGREIPKGITAKERIALFSIATPEGEPLQPDELPESCALKGHTVTQRELRLKNGAGEWVPIWVSAAPTRSPEQEVNGAVVIMENIAKLKRLEQLRDEFSSIVAHDLKTPLATVVGHTELLRRRIPKQGPPERLYSSLDSIRKSVYHLNAMIDDLTDYSRLEANRLAIRPRDTDLVVLLNDLCSRLDPLFPGSIELNLADKEMMIHADPARLEQILNNLITNAIRYTPEGANIVVGARSDAETVEISVHDFGPGIPEEEQAQIFQRFGRGAKAKGEGLGLGLYIARGLARAHGGDIRIVSKVGEGSTFHLILPKVPAHEQE